MSILSDKTIRKLALEQGMITPFTEKQKGNGIISYGLSSYGYDARVGPEWKVFIERCHPWRGQPNIVDAKDSARYADHLDDVQAEDFVIIPPNSFALGRTVETFKIPRDVMVVCVGKSTYARVGVIVNVTPLEPEWEGQVTLEFSNTTPLPAKIYVNEGACQFLFFRGDEPCEVSYADRGGKYQGQQGVVLPRILGGGT